MLLLLDNDQSHISSDVINYVVVVFPPHCSHQLRPLDKAVYGPFKTFINAASDNWMREPQNAGKSMSLHVIPSHSSSSSSSYYYYCYKKKLPSVSRIPRGLEKKLEENVSE